MAKQEKFKSFKLPESLQFGFTFMMFAEHVVDRVPEFQSVSGARKGASLIEAVSAAEKSEDNLVKWPTPLWELVKRLLESEQFQMPKNYFVRNGSATDQLAPLRMYLPHAEAILEAEDFKSEDPVAESKQEAPPTS